MFGPFKLNEKSGTIVFRITTMQLFFNAVAVTIIAVTIFLYFTLSFGFYCAFSVACG